MIARHAIPALVAVLALGPTLASQAQATPTSNRSASVSHGSMGRYGSYETPQRSLTMVWDTNAPAINRLRDTTVLTDSTVPRLVSDYSSGFTADSDRASPPQAHRYGNLNVPAGTVDGTYDVGTGPGQLALEAGSGEGCSRPTGSAQVRNSAPSGSTFTSITVDADLQCAGGGRLRAELRWQTPDAMHALTMAPLTVLQAAPDATDSTSIVLSNNGSLPITLGEARLIAAEERSSTVPLELVASNCLDQTLAPGQSCSVSVRYTAGSAGAREGNAFLTMGCELGELSLGRVIGQQPAAQSGPQRLAATGVPGSLELSWAPPTTMDDWTIRGWRVETVTGTGEPKVVANLINYARSFKVRGLVTGDHLVRLVLLTSDGRQIPATLAVQVPRRWLLMSTDAGVRTADPEGTGTAGGLIGKDEYTQGVSVSPDRDVVLTATGFVSPVVRAISTATGRGPLLSSDGYYPQVSPDGARVAIQHPATSANGSTPAQTGGITVVPITGGASTLIPNSAEIWTPSWDPDGMALVGANGESLVRISVATGTRTTLPGTAGANASAVSRTGQVAYVARVGSQDFVRITSATGGASATSWPLPSIAAYGGSYGLAWDPTGRWVAVSGSPYQHTPQTYVYDTTQRTALVRTVLGGHSVAWLDPESQSPTATLTVPSLTSRTATLAVSGTDPDHAVGGLRGECRLDSSTVWVACEPSWRVSGLSTGQHTAAVRVTDPTGLQSAPVSRSWTVDASAPVAVLAVPPVALTSTALTLSWSGSDTGGSNVASYDVRRRSAPIGATFGGWVYPATQQRMAAIRWSTTVPAGYQSCYAVRARDAVGNVGAWSTEKCASSALDDRTLTAGAGWTRGTSTAYAYGTWTKAVRTGSSLSRASVQSRRLAIVAMTCATCGSVDVYQGGVRLGRISLHSTKTAYRKVLWAPLQSTSRTGTVVLRTTSAATVTIDGLVVQH